MSWTETKLADKKKRIKLGNSFSNSQEPPTLHQQHSEDRRHSSRDRPSFSLQKTS
ncbi:22593_t:CDS:2 [Gigaspora margarita]|uniref:22593_t:CDS:1 n=1 Tax=Gigaspora margarita TaxID=4874 RepID=A0ABN7V0F9_GIGMA|nr:22593_t:CDS:2 [Gigaspora margarita]